MIVFPASCKFGSADKTEMATQCPLHYTLHREKGQRKRALEKHSLAREASCVPQKKLRERVQRFTLTEEFSVETKDSEKALSGFKYDKLRKASSHQLAWNKNKTKSRETHSEL